MSISDTSNNSCHVVTQVEQYIDHWRNKFADDQTYVLIDPIINDPFEQFPDADNLQRCYLPLRHRDIVNAERPYLLAVPNKDRLNRLLVATIESAIADLDNYIPPLSYSVCAWIVSSVTDPKVLARYLSLAAEKRDTRYQRRFVRYWDPRVVGLLAKDAICQSLLPSISGCWISLSPVTGLPTNPTWTSIAAEQCSDPMLSLEQEERLQKLSQINAIRSNIIVRLQQSRHWPNVSSLEHLVQLAHRLGLIRPRDINAFVASRYCADVPIEETKRIQDVLTACSEHGMQYEKLVAGWSGAEWQDVVAEARKIVEQKMKEKA